MFGCNVCTMAMYGDDVWCVCMRACVSKWVSDHVFVAKWTINILSRLFSSGHLSRRSLFGKATEILRILTEVPFYSYVCHSSSAVCVCVCVCHLWICRSKSMWGPASSSLWTANLKPTDTWRQRQWDKERRTERDRETKGEGQRQKETIQSLSVTSVSVQLNRAAF